MAKKPEVIKNTRYGLVVQSPRTKRLYGISFDRQGGREVVNVTRLEEPKKRQKRTRDRYLGHF